MHKRNTTANFEIQQLFIDNIILLACYIVSNLISFQINQHFLFVNHLNIYTMFAVIFTLTMLLTRMYNITTFFYIDRVLLRIMISTILAALLLGTFIFLSKSEYISRLLFLLFSSLSCVAVFAGRVLIHKLKASKVGNGFTYILFVGSEKVFDQYMKYIDKTSMKLKVAKHIYYDDAALKTPDDFLTLLISLSVNEVSFVVSFDEPIKIQLQAFLNACEEIGVTSRLIVDTYDLDLSKRFVSSIGTYPVITYHSISFDKVQLFIKSLIDVAGAFLGLFVLSPLFLITAVIIKLESPGPVFFKQTRVGMNGRQFKIYKFRSMCQDAEARKGELASQNIISSNLMFKMPNDPRITRFGAFLRKTSIDELPQLINVLKRDMSLVGTRPPTVDEVRNYSPRHRRRISIMPGITGMWQVSGRSNILDFDEVVRLDEKYIDEWCLSLDIKLLFKTIGVVFFKRGAH